MSKAKIIGTGSCVGPNIITNADLEKKYNTSDTWIRKNMGITARTKADDCQNTSDLAVEACKKAIEMANIKPRDIDLIILATCSPDHLAPATALQVQKKLKAGKAAVFDMKAQCAGFVHLLVVGAQMACGDFKNVLVVASEILLRMMDPNDRFNNALFSDGAAAAIITKAENDDEGILSYDLASNPNFYDAAIINVGTAHPITKEGLDAGDHFLKWNFSSSQKKGDDILDNTDMKSIEWRFVVNSLIDTLEKSTKKLSKTPKELDFLLIHPGTIKSLDAVLDGLGLPKEKTYNVFEKYGNSSGPQVGIALDEAVRSGMIKKGDLVGMNAIGMGMQWGSVVFRWSI